MPQHVTIPETQTHSRQLCVHTTGYFQKLLKRIKGEAISLVASASSVNANPKVSGLKAQIIDGALRSRRDSICKQISVNHCSLLRKRMKKRGQHCSYSEKWIGRSHQHSFHLFIPRLYNQGFK